MKTSLLMAALLLSALTTNAQEFSTATMRGITIDEAFSLALAESETLAQQGQGVAYLQAAEKVIRSSFKPSATFNGSQFYQDTPNSSSGSNSTSKMQNGVNLHYDAFSGMRDYLSARAAGAQTEAARLQLLRAKQSLYQSVAEACLNLLFMQEQIAVRKHQLEVMGDRIKELQSRERIGRSRKSEVLAAQANLAQNEAQLQDALGQERIAQHMLQFLTGVEYDLAPRQVDQPTLAILESYLAKTAQRPDIAALRKSAEAAKTQIEVQKKQRWPSVALDGNYYFDRPSSSAGIKWDFTASLQIPIYTGGKISAQVTQAKTQESTAELALHLALRQAQSDVRQSYDDLRFSLSTVTALEKALDLSGKNFESQSADYRYGLVTNIDVLTAMDNMLQTNLQLKQARIEAFRAAVELEVATGGPANIR